MKRKLTALLLVLLLAVTLAVPALAAGDWVTDEAGLLTDQQISQLSQRAAALAHSSGVGVYIRTVDDYADYGFTDVETASYTLYHNDSLGVGDGRDGVLLLLSVSNRKYAAFVYGDKAELLFPDSALQQLEDGFLDDFRNDDWYGGFCDYIDGCAGLLNSGAQLLDFFFHSTPLLEVGPEQTKRLRPCVESGTKPCKIQFSAVPPVFRTVKRGTLCCR